MQHYFYSMYSLGVINFKLFPFNLKLLSGLLYLNQVMKMYFVYCMMYTLQQRCDISKENCVL